MSIEAATEPMASDKSDVAYQIRCTRAWIERVHSAASDLGLSAASYIRMTVSQRMDQDGVPKPGRKPRDSTRKPKRPADN